MTEPRRCGICGKPLVYYQKAGCCYAHGREIRLRAHWEAAPHGHCGVCGTELARRQKIACCNAHRGILQQTVEHAQQSVRARLDRGQFADPARTAENWAP